MVVHADTASPVQAGLLTLESSYRLCLPVPLEQWHDTAFVLDYSGGPVPELHGVPYLRSIGAPERCYRVLADWGGIVKKHELLAAGLDEFFNAGDLNLISGSL